MKLIATKGAPDIPLEVLEAQEAGRLVFFCGAGVSYPAGMPDFRKLVGDVYTNLPAVPNNGEQAAIKSELYDRALNMLEERIQKNDMSGPNQVRRAIIEALILADDADLESHEAILEISKSKDRRPRLVTTNVDKAFELVANGASIHSAPTLPVPKPHRWHSLVHLHGIIDTVNDPDGQHLVFTSGDFGTAYLTERWASKFVTELFSNFVVLFVGYSINDPVIRYMTDAISAELRTGYEGFNRPYVFAHSAPGKREQETKNWRDKGVEPILYSFAHTNLHRTLKEWAVICRAGLRGKGRVIREKAIIAPLPPYDHDESVRQVVDTLRERTVPNDDEVTGYPAKVFSELSSPVAPIEWLPILAEEGLLSVSKPADQLHTVHFDPVGANLLMPNVITYHLWHWLLQHFESDDLVRWVINSGVCLHPKFRELVGFHLDRNSPAEPYLTFWRVLASGYTLCESARQRVEYTPVSELDPTNGVMAIRHLLDLLAPSYELKKSFTWSSGTWGEEPSPAPYDINVVIGLSEWAFQEIEGLPSYPDEFVGLLSSATEALQRALELREFAGKADYQSDQSYWDLVSISRHEQNHRLRNWTILIEICRDLFEAAWELDKPLALAVVAVWRRSRYPAFRRLVLYAYTANSVVAPSEALSYLLQDNSWWLWSTETYREKFRLLAAIGPQFDRDDIGRLLTIVCNGPPRDMYIAELSSDEWRFRSDREIWLMLAKLSSFGLDLDERSVALLRQISDAYPDWQLQQGERDEFLHWSESGTGAGYETDMTVAGLFDLPAEEIVRLLSQASERFGKGRIDLFRVGSKESPATCVQVFQLMAETGNWNLAIWHAGLVGLADSSEPSWRSVSTLLVAAPDEIFSGEDWAVAWWVKKSSERIEPRSADEGLFWKIADRLFECVPRDVDLGEGVDLVAKAINNSVGIFTETIMTRFAAYKLEAGSGIPDSKIRTCVNRLVAEEGDAFVLARVILASRLQYFYTVDPDWTKESLLARMDWTDSVEAAALWQGYLWMPRISADLVLSIKDQLLQSMARLADIHNLAERLHQTFVIVCLNYPDLYTATQQHQALVSIGASGLKNVAAFLSRSVRGDEVDADNYWKEKLEPFIRRAWPKEVALISTATSRNLVLIVIELDQQFEHSIEIVVPIVRSFPDQAQPMNRLVQTQLPEKYPAQVLDLLDAVVSREFQRPAEPLRQILDRLVAAMPELRGDPRYSRLENILLARE
jgi:SIR2-like protein